jgi:hypothetical protein
LVQLPQCWVSVFVLRHAPVHSICPDGQLQVLFVQVAPVPHLVPQAPQFSGLLATSTHAPPEHCISFDWHIVVHLPALHTCVPVHLLPQEPQLAVSC